MISLRDLCPGGERQNVVPPPFFFVRHGETVSNVANRLAGSTDVPLTRRGREQAGVAAGLLVGRGIRRVFSSPLQRARETAWIIAKRLDLKVETVPGLAERNWGSFEGCDLPIDLHTEQLPDGESLTVFNQRISAALMDCFARAGEDDFAVISHAGAFLAICDVFGLPTGAEWIANAHPVRVALRRDGRGARLVAL